MNSRFSRHGNKATNHLVNADFEKDSWKALKQYSRIHYELTYLRGDPLFIQLKS